LEGKLFVTKQDKASIHRYFIFNSLNISEQSRPINLSSKIEKCHTGGGVVKVSKKCHVLFEWPLTPEKQSETLTHFH
jgi:hypothetical protein